MVPRLHLPLVEPEDVIRHLGKQERHWKAGRSARALVQSWGGRDTFPDSIHSLLATHTRFRSAQLVDAFLERQVDLGTSGRPSQTDLLAIIGIGAEIAVMGVEAKAGEPFGKYVHEWNDGSAGKRTRLRALCNTLGLTEESATPLRYQLLHRTVSTVIEAQRYRSRFAILIVQSFGDDEKSFGDFTRYINAVGLRGNFERGVLTEVRNCDGVDLFAGWADDSTSVDRDHVRCFNKLRAYANDLARYADVLRRWCDKQHV
jgi:hypothetical protein